MASYFLVDLQSTDEGDLVIERGDLRVASVAQSQRQLVVNILSTTRGDYRNDPEVGWGNEGFAGRPNSQDTHKAMERDLGISLGMYRDIAMEDLDFAVSIGDPQTALVTLIHKGSFFEADGEIAAEPIVLSWKFALQNGKLTIVERET